MKRKNILTFDALKSNWEVNSFSETRCLIHSLSIFLFMTVIVWLILSLVSWGIGPIFLPYIFSLSLSFVLLRHRTPLPALHLLALATCLIWTQIIVGVVVLWSIREISEDPDLIRRRCSSDSLMDVKGGKMSCLGAPTRSRNARFYETSMGTMRGAAITRARTSDERRRWTLFLTFKYLKDGSDLRKKLSETMPLESTA